MATKVLESPVKQLIVPQTLQGLHDETFTPLTSLLQTNGITLLVDCRQTPSDNKGNAALVAIKLAALASHHDNVLIVGTDPATTLSAFTANSGALHSASFAKIHNGTLPDEVDLSSTDTIVWLADQFTSAETLVATLTALSKLDKPVIVQCHGTNSVTAKRFILQSGPSPAPLRLCHSVWMTASPNLGAGYLCQMQGLEGQDYCYRVFASWPSIRFERTSSMNYNHVLSQCNLMPF